MAIIFVVTIDVIIEVNITRITSFTLSLSFTKIIYWMSFIKMLKYPYPYRAGRSWLFWPNFWLCPVLLIKGRTCGSPRHVKLALKCNNRCSVTGSVKSVDKLSRRHSLKCFTTLDIPFLPSTIGQLIFVHNNAEPKQLKWRST